MSKASSLVVTESPVTDIFAWNVGSFHLSGPYIYFFARWDAADPEALGLVDHELVTSDEHKFRISGPRARSIVTHPPRLDKLGAGWENLAIWDVVIRDERGSQRHI